MRVTVLVAMYLLMACEVKNGEKVGGGKGERGGGREKRNCLQSVGNILLNSICQQTGSNSAILLVSSSLIKK